MAPDGKQRGKSFEESFREKIQRKEQRKMSAKKKSFWISIGAFGLIGWAVAMPTVAGALLGYWLDREYTSSHSWTLTLLLLGLFGGCVSAWRWMTKESSHINGDKENK